MFEMLESAAGLGVGALLAVVIFFVYRWDRKASEDRLREDRKFMEDRLTKIIDADQVTRGENTKVMSELTTLLLRLNGKRK